MELQTNLLPGRIRMAVENREPRAVSIGRSGARVWVFDDRVLKVERTSPAADREYELLSWLDGRANAARVIDFERQDEFNYLLETRVPGVMTCDKDALQDPVAVTHALAQGLIALRDISVAELLPAAPVEGDGPQPAPSGSIRFDSRAAPLLVRTRERFKRGQIHHSDLSDECLSAFVNMPTPRLRRDARGSSDFPSVNSVLSWLDRNRPTETLAFVQGDYCLPNVFMHSGRFSGLIDFGRGGVADAWMDIALCVRSMWYNFCFLGGQTRAEFQARRAQLFQELEIEPDEKRLRYYFYLDELS